MRATFTLFILGIVISLRAQNNVHLFNAKGQTFRVLMNEKYINASPQADVVITKITADTLRLKLEFDGRRYGITLYLLNKGKHTVDQQFSYLVEPLKDKIEVTYMGMDPLSADKRQLVPDKPSPAAKP